MADTISKLIKERACKRREAAGMPVRSKKSAGSIAATTAKPGLPRTHDVETRLRARLAKLVRGGELSPKQHGVLDRLVNAFDAMKTRHGRIPEEIENDETFTADHPDFARAVRAAEKAGILNFKVLQRHPAAMAARDALPSLRHQRQKIRRIKPMEKRDPLRQLWTQHGKWLSGEVKALREKGLSVEGMRGAVAAKLRRKPEDGRKLADHIVRMSREGWRKRVRSLLDR